MNPKYLDINKSSENQQDNHVKNNLELDLAISLQIMLMIFLCRNGSSTLHLLRDHQIFYLKDIVDKIELHLTKQSC